MRFALLIHLLGSILWIGGMFFAYVALRPAAAKVLEPPQRLALWKETLRRFFTWVWVAIVGIYGSGFHMLSSAYGVKATPMYVSAMLAIATLMTFIYAYIFFKPYKDLLHSVDGQHWKPAAAALNRIRRLVATNLILGAITVTVAVVGGLLA